MRVEGPIEERMEVAEAVGLAVGREVEVEAGEGRRGEGRRGEGRRSGREWWRRDPIPEI